LDDGGPIFFKRYSSRGVKKESFHNFAVFNLAQGL